MSDIRTKLLLGTTISALTIMFVMASGVFTNDTASVTELNFPLNGHWTFIAVHPDGSASYTQSDNTLQGAAKTEVAVMVLSGLPADITAHNPFNCIAIGDAGTPVTTTPGLTAPVSAGTPPLCDVDGVGSQQAGVTGGAGEIGRVTVIFTIDAADAGAITEATLGQTIAGQEVTGGSVGVLSHVALAAPVPVAGGTLLTVNFDLTFGEGN